MPQAVLGVAFSFGIPMAFAAVQGGADWTLAAIRRVPPHAWALLLGNLFWVLAYDTEYAMVDRDDDLKIGIKTSAITFGPLGRGGGDGLLRAVPAELGGLGRRWAWAAWYLAGRRRGGGAGGLALHADPRPHARGLLQGLPANHWVGFAVFAGVVLDLALR
jgi:4-hydroxybenzoate polyprenyltransferase